MQRGALAVSLVLAGLAAGPAYPSTFFALSPREMVAGATAVVQGEVVETAAFWNAQHTAILTEAVVRVDEEVVGKADAFVRVRTFGGRVGDLAIEAHGFPTFARGERLVLFLENDRWDKEAGLYRVFGYRQGEFRLTADPAGETLAVPTVETAGARRLKADGTEAPAPRTVPLAELKAQIRDTARSLGRADVR
jgi:hypothetical protein